MTKTLNNLRYPKLDITDGLKTSHTERVWNAPFYRCSVIRKRIKEGFYVEIECVLYLRFLKLLKLKHLKSLRSQDGPQAGWDPLGTHHIAESIERGVNRVGEEAIRLTDALDTSTVRMQGISNQITSTLMSFIETVTPEMRQANNTFAKVAHDGITVDMLAPLLALLNDPIKCIGALAVLYVFVEIVEHKYELPNLKYVKVILGTIALFRSPSALKKLFVNWIKVDTILAQPQSDWSDWAQVLVQGVLFAALGCTLDFNSLTNSVKNLVSAATNASKLQELFNSICDWFKNVCNLAASSMGLELFEWMKPQETVLKKFIVRVNELTATYTADPMAINVEYVNDVSRLLMEVNDYMITVPINSKNTPVHNAIKNLQDKISMLHKAVIDAGMNIGERYEPALLTEAGAAGCGKTFLREFNLQDFAMALADTVEDVVETSRNWKTKIYSWPIDPKHHDQYRGQLIVSFPDLFCQTDAEGQVSEASSLVYMIGDQPHNMTAAEMSKKQRLWLLMILAYAQTNQIYLSRNMFKSIRNVEAVIRRLNRFGFYVNVTDKYTLKDAAGNPIIDPATKRIRGREHDLELYGQVDRTKVPVGTIPDDMYQYRRLDFGKGCFVDNKVYSRKQYVRMAIKHVKEMKDAGRLKKDMLAEHMAEVAMNRVNELNQEQGFEMQADFDVEEEILEDPKHVVIEGLPEKYVDPVTQNNEKLERILKQDTLLTEKYEALMARKHNDLLEQCLAELELDVDYETADEGDRMSIEAIPQMDNDEVTDDEMPVLEVDDNFAEEILNAVGDEDDDETESPVIVSDVSSVDTPVPLVVERVNRDFFGEMGEVNAHVVKKKTQNSRSRAKILENKYSEITKTRVSYEQYTTIVNAIQACRENIELQSDRVRRDPNCLAATYGRQHDRFDPIRGIVFKCMQNTVKDLEDDPVTGPLVRTLSVQQIFDFIKFDFDDINDKVIEMRFNYLFKDPVIASLNTASAYISNLYACIRHHPIVTGVTGAVTAAAVYARQTLTDIFYSRLFQMGLELAVVTLISSTITFGVLILLDWAICSYLEGKAAKNKSKSLKNVAQSATTDTESVTEFIDKYMDNFAALYVVMYKPGETKKYQRHPCNVTFLGGMTAVIVHHAALGIEKLKKLCDRDGRKLELVLIPFRGGEVNKSTERVPVADFEFDLEGPEAKELALRDLAIIKFKGIRNRSALYKHIPPLEVMDWIKTKTNLEGKFIERPVGEDLIISGIEKRTDVWINFGGPNARYVGSVEYRGETYEFDSYLYPSFKLTGVDKEFVSVKGYCTSPCFIIDSRKNVKIREWSRANMPWFAYLHTSLQRQVANGVPLFAELFEKWTKNIKTQKPVVDNVRETMKAYADIVSEELELVADEGQSDILEITTKLEKLDLNHESIAEINHKFYVPNKSEIKRSPLFGIDPVTRYPSRMGKYIDKEGDLVSTMTVARTPCGANSVCLDGPIDEVIEQAMRRVYSDSVLPVYRELLDFDSCLYGDMAYNLTGTNWQSSCGFFFRMMKDYFKTDWKVKAWMLGPDQKLKPQVYKTVKRLFDYHEAKLVKGERVVSLITDSIKDELLPKGKNGRLFCVYDFIYLLLCKRYFGAFAGWIFQNRVRNGIAIGVNPYSPEWGGIVEHLLFVSNKCLFLDHNKFDKNCLRKIMKCLLILCTMYYNDKGSEAEKVRELLFEEIVDSYHVVMVDGKMYIYGWGQGNTSGNFLTAILNSLINICYLYICSIIAWLATMGILFTELKALPTNPVDKALAYVVLGDDVAASVNDELMPGVHFNSIRTVAKSYLGLTITDELKSEGDCPNFRSIEEGSFLGRKFVKIVFEGKIIWVGVLRIYSTIERVQWIKGLFAPEIEIDKIETCFLELSLGPREVFDKYVTRYTDAAVKAYRKYPRFTDYDTARKYVLTLGNYTYTFDDFLNSEGNYTGPDIEVILQKLRNQEIARDFVDGFTAEIDALLDPGFSFGEGETIATEEVPREEPNEFPSLRRIVTENQEFKCSSEDAVAHSDWASCAPDDRPHKKRKVVEVYEEVDMSMDVEAQNCNVEVEFELAEPQMDSTDFEAGITMEKESLTTFIEAGSEIKGTSTQSTRKTSTYIETDADIKSFLQRPQLVAGAAWATTDVINANLETISLSALLASVPWWADKIKGFNLIRGDFMVKVMLNASPFQQGKLIAHYLPNQNNFLTTNPGYGSFKNKNLVQKVQHPHVEIDCRVTSSTMRIPYISPTSWYAQKEAIYDWGTFYLDVFSPLMTGAAAPGGQNHVDYSIYVWMENVELSAPAIPQSSSREVTVRNGIGESKENEGPIATGLRKVGKVANLLSSIPLVSDYAKTTEWVSNILSNAASSLGWSKPRELTGSTNVFQNMYRYLGTFDGPDVAQPGGLSVLNRLETIDYGSYTNADEMSTEFLYKIPYYVGEFEWDATDAIGSILYSLDVSPTSIVKTDADNVATHTCVYEYHVPFTYLARFFKYWRGSMKLTLKFIKTQMHSGRAEVVWIPVNTIATAATLHNSGYAKKAVVDLRTEDTVTFELPYMMYSDYLPTSNSASQNNLSGQISVTVVNALRAPESCNQLIAVQVFMTPGEDFELAVPGSNLSSSIPYEPQADGTELVIDSVDQGKVITNMELGGKNVIYDGLFHAKRCIGEKFLSIKSLLLRNTVIKGPTGGSYTATNYLAIDPWYISVSRLNGTTGAQQCPMWAGDAFSLLAPCYAYFRGSIKYTVIEPSIGYVLGSAILPVENHFGTEPVKTTSALSEMMQYSNSIALVGADTGYYPFEPVNYFDQGYGAVQHVPYYNKLPFTLTTYYNGVDTHATELSKPSSVVTFVKPVASWSASANFMRSVGDDFQLMFFTGCPPLARSYT